MATRTLHLICNAHIDPVWLWEWQEGAAEAVSTFRVAADLTESGEFPGFIFNHNEALLYAWIETFEPALFKRIQKLVAAGRWHIMSGWFLQPDCNMPSGESLIRQIEVGRRYFLEKFGKAPTTAINFDPFGHSRGLVQIMAKAGYDSYLICRPMQAFLPLKDDLFTWEGFDGSRITVRRVSSWYNSPLGGAAAKVTGLLHDRPGDTHDVLLWGVGNHGGGPSWQDLRDLKKLIHETAHPRVTHSTPEAYFAGVRDMGRKLPVHRDDLNPWGPGCYTSQIAIKRRHRLLEAELFSTEKMLAVAVTHKLMSYPAAEMDEAQRDLLLAEFHDILPGSSIQPVEFAGNRLLDHGLEILSRVKAEAFFKLAAGQPKAKDGQIPILVHNPHPYPVEATVECEFQLADQNWKDTWTHVTATQQGRPLPTQVEQELSNLNLDWRKRVVFTATLEPLAMNRFDCTLNTIKARPTPKLKPRDGRLNFNGKAVKAVINTRTGLMDRLTVKGVSVLATHAMRGRLIADNEDPWETAGRSFRQRVGEMKLLTAREAALFAGVRLKQLDPVRVIEDGPVRTVVEALFGVGTSRMVVHYKLPKLGDEVEVAVRVYWQSANQMLKLSIPTRFNAPTFLGQTACGVQALPVNGDEAVAQQWLCLHEKGKAMTVVTDTTYGSSLEGGELLISLLRSPAYSGHPIHQRPVVPQDRHTPRTDQGEHLFRFWIKAGATSARLAAIDREALAHHQRPMAVSFFPPGTGEPPLAPVVLEDKVIQVMAMRPTRDGKALLLRLFEPTGRKRRTLLYLPLAERVYDLELEAFEVATLRVDPKRGSLKPVSMIEA